MSKRYPGNFITGNAVALSQTSNNGIWDVKDVSTAVAAGNWQEPDGIYEIPKSVRFKWVSNTSSSYFSRTPPAAGNRRTWTWSGWVKRSKLDTGYINGLFEAQDPSNAQIVAGIRFETDGTLKILDYSSGYTTQLITTQVFRDLSAWYHIVVAYDTTQTATTNRVKLYVNGQQVINFSTATYPSLNSQGYINTSGLHVVGACIFTNVIEYLDGYMAEVNFIDGQALDPSYFGYTDPITNIWQPKRYAGSYGQNGFYLPFNDATTAASLGFDKGNTKSVATRVGSAQYSTAQSKFGGSSLLLNSASSDYLTIGSAGADTGSGSIFAMSSAGFTAEMWVYFNSTAEQTLLENFTGGGGPGWTFYKLADGSLHIYLNDGTTATDFGSSTGLLTTGQWYHLAFTRNGSTVKSFINGTQVATGTYTGGELYQSSYPLQIGHRNPGDGRNFYTSAYINDLRITKGVSRYNASFTAPTTANPTDTTDPYWSSVVLAMPFNGVSGTYSFQNYSMYANNFAANNISVTAGASYDSMVDSPTNIFTTATDTGGVVSGNYAVFNDNDSAAAIYDGGLRAVGQGDAVSSIACVVGGKWYCEVTIGAIGSNLHLGFTKSVNSGLVHTQADSGRIVYQWQGGVYLDGTGMTPTPVTGLATYTAGDVIGLAIDTVAGTVTFYKNNTSVFTKTDSVIAANEWKFLVYCDNSSSNATINFGQRAFTYTPPSGYKSLNTTNIQALGASGVGNAGITPQKWFDVSVTGGLTGVQKVTFNGKFSPDLIWWKSRGSVSNHVLSDSSRGAGPFFRVNTTDVEQTSGSGLISLDSDGYTVNGAFDATSYASWAWKQSPTAGLNVISYTGNGVNNRAISHNLGTTPTFIIVKSRDNAYNWDIYHQSLGIGATMIFTASATRNYSAFGSSAPTSSNFYTQDNFTNTNGSRYTAYVWAEVPGFSRFGSWTNTNSNDGAFVYTGFRPAFILLKNTNDVEQWYIFDSKRRTYNVAAGSDTSYISPNSTAAEGYDRTPYGGNTATIDFVSNGFKIRSTNSNSGEISYQTRQFVYAAFAESPFALNNRAR